MGRRRVTRCPGSDHGARVGRVGLGPQGQVQVWVRVSGLTHNEALGFREFAEQFPEVFIPLFVRRAQHLDKVSEVRTRMGVHTPNSAPQSS